MAPVLELESTLTDRYQTTVPDAVRRTLRLGKRDKLRYQLQPNGAVLLTRGAPVEAEDPVVGKFLRFLAKDMAKHPERLSAVSASLVRRVRTLVRTTTVDLDQPLEPEGK
jgi:antitoxin PrlF